MKKCFAFSLAVFVVCTAFLANALAGKQAFRLYASGPDNFRLGDTVNIVISVKDIKLTDGMSYVSFRLYYDNTKVIPVIKNGFSEGTENRTTFITKCPNFESWEVIGLLNEEEGYYELTFGTEKISGTKAAVKDGDLVFTIPFTVANDSSDKIAFSLPAEYVEGGNALLTEKEVPGTANDVIIEKYIPPGSDDESRPDNESEDDQSRDESGEDESRDDESKDDESNDEQEDALALISDADVWISDGYLHGLTDKATIEYISNQFKNKVVVSGVGTGETVIGGGQKAIIIILGDISGDGKINSKDYLFSKRAFLKTYTLDKTQLKAACFEKTDLPTSKDYLKIKRHFLGTYNIFKN